MTHHPPYLHFHNVIPGLREGGDQPVTLTGKGACTKLHNMSCLWPMLHLCAVSNASFNSF